MEGDLDMSSYREIVGSQALHKLNVAMKDHADMPRERLYILARELANYAGTSTPFLDNQYYRAITFINGKGAFTILAFPWPGQKSLIRLYTSGSPAPESVDAVINGIREAFEKSSLHRL